MQGLFQKVMCKVDDPVARRIHGENAERMVLARFVAGLKGVAGKQIRYANPRKIEQAVSIALAVQEAEKSQEGGTRRGVLGVRVRRVKSLLTRRNGKSEKKRKIRETNKS